MSCRPCLLVPGSLGSVGNGSPGDTAEVDAAFPPNPGAGPRRAGCFPSLTGAVSPGSRPRDRYQGPSAHSQRWRERTLSFRRLRLNPDSDKQETEESLPGCTWVGPWPLLQLPGCLLCSALDLPARNPRSTHSARSGRPTRTWRLSPKHGPQTRGVAQAAQAPRRPTAGLPSSLNNGH